MGRIGKEKLVEPRQHKKVYLSQPGHLHSEVSVQKCSGRGALMQECLVRDSSYPCLGEFSDKTSSQGQNCNKIL